MRYIENIKIIDNSFYNINIFDKGFEIVCGDVNLLVGNQGTGKSTLLKLIQQQHSDIKLFLSNYCKKHSVKTFYFDSEKDNPRVKDPLSYTTPSGDDIGIGFTKATTSRFKSHGEIIKNFIIKPLLTAKNSIILLDEPESGLSIQNQFNLINAIKIAVKNNCQLFIATHCYTLIKEFDVISLDNNKQMKGMEFINQLK